MLWVIGVAQDEGGDLSISQGLQWLRIFLQDLLRGGGECLPVCVHKICWKRAKGDVLAIIIKRLLRQQQLDYWIGALYAFRVGRLFGQQHFARFDTVAGTQAIKIEPVGQIDGVEADLVGAGRLQAID